MSDEGERWFEDDNNGAGYVIFCRGVKDAIESEAVDCLLGIF
jgi:hypothetical protein